MVRERVAFEKANGGPRGYGRMYGELKKLGYDVRWQTVRRVMLDHGLLDDPVAAQPVGRSIPQPANGSRRRRPEWDDCPTLGTSRCGANACLLDGTTDWDAESRADPWQPNKGTSQAASRTEISIAGNRGSPW